MPRKYTDKELAEGIKASNPLCLTYFYEKYIEMVRKYIKSRYDKKGDFESDVNFVMNKIIKKFKKAIDNERYVERGKQKAFIKTILIGSWIEIYRARENKPIYSDLDTEAYERKPKEGEDDYYRDIWELISVPLKKECPDCYKLLTQQYLEGYSQKEIADMTSNKKENIKNKMYHCRKKAWDIYKKFKK